MTTNPFVNYPEGEFQRHFNDFLAMPVNSQEIPMLRSLHKTAAALAILVGALAAWKRQLS